MLTTASPGCPHCGQHETVRPLALAERTRPPRHPGTDRIPLAALVIAFLSSLGLGYLFAVAVALGLQLADWLVGCLGFVLGASLLLAWIALLDWRFLAAPSLAAAPRVEPRPRGRTPLVVYYYCAHCDTIFPEDANRGEPLP